MDIPHDKQRNLLAIITDANGKQAITGGHFIRDLLNWRFMCADRGNSICDSILTDEIGPYLVGPSAPYQRKAELFGVFPGYGMRPFMTSPPELTAACVRLACRSCLRYFTSLPWIPKIRKCFPKWRHEWKSRFVHGCIPSGFCLFEGWKWQYDGCPLRDNDLSPGNISINTYFSTATVATAPNGNRYLKRSFRTQNCFYQLVRS